MPYIIVLFNCDKMEITRRFTNDIVSLVKICNDTNPSTKWTYNLPSGEQFICEKEGNTVKTGLITFTDNIYLIIIMIVLFVLTYFYFINKSKS